MTKGLVAPRAASRRIDPDGVVTGWAAERAAGQLRALAGTDFYLPAGCCSAGWTHRPRWNKHSADASTAVQPYSSPDTAPGRGSEAVRHARGRELDSNRCSNAARTRA